MNSSPALLSEEEVKTFRKTGYLLAKSVLSSPEVEAIREKFEELHARGSIPGCFQAVSAEEANGDILKQYPRMMHPHKVDEDVKWYMLHPKVMKILSELMGEEALACQSMYYFKPPGARGQALHQDNFFLKVEPGTCVAAWMAIDDADEENGGLVVVPGTHAMDIECHTPTERSDLFAYVMEVPKSEQYEAVPVRMKSGDVLFFNGNLIHGSFPNKTQNRFRRSFICHYCGESTVRIGNSYRPLYAADGTVLDREVNMDSGPCGGEFVETAPH